MWFLLCGRIIFQDIISPTPFHLPIFLFILYLSVTKWYKEQEKQRQAGTPPAVHHLQTRRHITALTRSMWLGASWSWPASLRNGDVSGAPAWKVTTAKDQLLSPGLAKPHRTWSPPCAWPCWPILAEVLFSPQGGTGAGNKVLFWFLDILVWCLTFKKLLLTMLFPSSKGLSDFLLSSHSGPYVILSSRLSTV